MKVAAEPCRFWRILLTVVVCLQAPAVVTAAANFTSGTTSAVKFGVHEITLTGRSDVDNPFDTLVTVTFQPPSDAPLSRTVHAFYDGDNTWRARVYVHEAGDWSWSSRCTTDQ
jgi:hypothetical protein